LPFFGIGGLPAANSNYPPVADSNENSGIPTAALQAQKRRFFPPNPPLFFVMLNYANWYKGRKFTTFVITNPTPLKLSFRTVAFLGASTVQLVITQHASACRFGCPP
jgi:hypothetical protein